MIICNIGMMKERKNITITHSHVSDGTMLALIEP